MNRFRNALFATATAMLFVQALLFTSPGQALAKDVTDVLVTNTLANPVFVRNIDDGRQPFSLFDTVGMSDGEEFSSRKVFTVPAGKRLVIESVSAEMYLPQGQTPVHLRLNTTAGGNADPHTIALFRQGTQNSLHQDAYAGTHALRAYADPGSAIVLSAMRSDGTGITIAYVSISGYYVDVP